MIERLRLKRFTAFEEINLKLSPGVNVFLGRNGTGKTHILKILYTVLAALREKKRISDKIIGVFLPRERRIGRLVRRAKGSSGAEVSIVRNGKRLHLSFSNHATDTLKLTNRWSDETIGPAVFIPVKEMLANAPGFLALHASREIHFEEVYADIILRAYMPLLRGPATKDRKRLLETIQKVMGGKVVLVEQEFHLKNRDGELEFTLLAEGIRKLALLWLLVQNGTLLEGSTLFWDEPEANLNPAMMRTVVEILLLLQRSGVQVFVATHDYVILKQFDLLKKKEDRVSYHALFADAGSTGVKIASTDEYALIEPNAIADTFSDLYDRDIQRAVSISNSDIDR